MECFCYKETITNEVLDIMPQGILPFKYEEEKRCGGMTAFAGLAPYLEFGYVMGLAKSIERRLDIRWGDQGWSDVQTVMALVLLNLAGGRLPSGNFGVNAAWRHIMIIALNLNNVMKRQVLGGTWESKRMKAIRLSLNNLPGRVLEHARTLIVRLVGGHPSNNLLFEMRRNIRSLAESG